MTRESRIGKLEETLTPGEVYVRVLRVPAGRWRAEPALSADEIMAYTHRVLGPFGAAA